MRWWRYLLLTPLALGVVGALLVTFAVIVVYPTLPALDELTQYRPQLPLRVYTADGTLIGEFGEERRALVKLKNVPKLMREAILAAEDARFYQHGGVDYAGILRAALADLLSGKKKEGASTITMQVARNFYLTGEKSFTRKFTEALLAYKIERALTKDQILELYINQIYLGQRAYGFAAAAQVYFGKPLNRLTLGEMAVLAGLPKSPSRDNPISSPGRAKERQRYVLARMRALGYITEAQYKKALAEPLGVREEQPLYAVNAPYVAEMARQVMYDRYGNDAYRMGFKVYTTLRDKNQSAADAALREGLLTYDRRHGYRGPEGFVPLPQNHDQLEKVLDQALEPVPAVNGLEPAVVLQASPKLIEAYRKGGEIVKISGPSLQFVAHALAAATDPKLRLRPGAIIRVEQNPGGRWEIAQLPQAEAALVSLDPKSGAIVALAGGFSFSRNKFNHATQAWRQPGSSFKPFVYSAALEKGFTAATIVNDAPIVIPPAYPGAKPWAPQNFEGDYLGPISLRTALAKSRNTASVRILEAIGIPYARDYATRFGFSKDQIPPYPTLVLGVGTFTPLQMAAAYSVFANGGYRITPYFVERIEDAYGNVLYQAKPVRAGAGAKQVIDPRNAFLMTSLMQDVVTYGTAARARELGRHDLAGKTGTTNDFVDAWFDGFNPDLVAVAWIGYDQPRSLGRNETGARAALPIWMGYMGRVLKGVPDGTYTPPPGLVMAKINPADGLRVAPGEDGKEEYFYQEDLPPVESMPASAAPSEQVQNQLF